MKIFIFSSLCFAMIFVLSQCTSQEQILISSVEIQTSWRTIEAIHKNNPDTVQEDENGIVVVWGHWYIQDFEFLADQTIDFKTNNFGKWELDELTGLLTVFDENDMETDNFNIHMDEAGFLIMENENLILKHRKL